MYYLSIRDDSSVQPNRQSCIENILYKCSICLLILFQSVLMISVGFSIIWYWWTMNDGVTEKWMGWILLECTKNICFANTPPSGFIITKLSHSIVGLVLVGINIYWMNQKFNDQIEEDSIKHTKIMYISLMLSGYSTFLLLIAGRPPTGWTGTETWYISLLYGIIYFIQALCIRFYAWVMYNPRPVVFV
jgi:uncharacterized membrane protein